MYRIEWSYLTELPEAAGAYKYGDEAHCEFLLRFLDVPQGEGHCAFFCVNVSAKAARRGFIAAEEMTRDALRARVTADVLKAFRLPREEALALLDKTYVWTNQDWRDEFASDALSAAVLAREIEEAFAGVGRDNGTTLREALAMDDYASAEEQAAARALDVDTDWHDAPLDVLSARCEFFSYLDAAGLRYYLPAAMLFSLHAENRAASDTPERTYWCLIPVVAPRDRGKGSNDGFDSEAFIARCAFTDAQVRVLYRFACFMAVEGGEGVDEEQLMPMRRWRESAGRRA